MKKIFKTIAVMLSLLTVMNIMTPGIYAAAADTADTAPSTAGEEINLVYAVITALPPAERALLR